MRLIIGAGERLKDGWVHHDIQKNDGIQIVCDFWELPIYVKNESCEEIEITHVLEHFPLKDTKASFDLLYKMLKPGGKIYIEVPNLTWHAEQILIDPTDRQIVEYMYGGQLNKYDYHYKGFTPELLREDLLASGFTVEELKPLSSIECRAIKSAS